MQRERGSLVFDGEGAVHLFNKGARLNHLIDKRLCPLSTLHLVLGLKELMLELLNPLVLLANHFELTFLECTMLLNFSTSSSPLATHLQQVSRVSGGGRDRRGSFDDFQDLRVNRHVKVLAICKGLVASLYLLAHEVRESTADYRKADVKYPLLTNKFKVREEDLQILRHPAYLARQHEQISLLW